MKPVVLRLTLRKKLLIILVLFAIVPTGIVTYGAYETFQDSSREAAMSSLRGLARAKAEAIDQFTDLRKKDVQRIAELLSESVTRLAVAEAEEKAPTQPEPGPDGEGPPLPKLEDAEEINPSSPGGTLPSGVAGPPTAPSPSKAVLDARGELNRTLGLLIGEQATFEELLIIAPDGRVQVSTFTAHEGKTAADVEYFRRGRASTFVQPVFISPITERLTMVIATPIKSVDKEDLGVLAARLNLKRFFDPMSDYTGLGRTGETVVGKKLADQVVLMAPTRHDENAALERKLPASGETLPIGLAARGETSSGIKVDYRGKTVLAAWTFVPTLEWGLLVKIDVEEADEPIKQMRLRLLFIGLIVIAIGVLVSFFFARAIIRPILELKDASEKISKGDFDVELAINSKDELGELADSFERMVAAIKFFRERSSEDEDEDEDEDEGDLEVEDEDESAPPTNSPTD